MHFLKLWIKYLFVGSDCSDYAEDLPGSPEPEPEPPKLPPRNPSISMSIINPSKSLQEQP